MPKKSKKSIKGRNRKPSAVSARKPSQAEMMNAAVRGARDQWRYHEKMMKSVEADVDKDPAGMASRLLGFSDRSGRLYARYVRLRFGVEVQAAHLPLAFRPVTIPPVIIGSKP